MVSFPPLLSHSLFPPYTIKRLRSCVRRTLPPRLLGLLRGLFRNRNELPKSRVKIAIIDDGVDIDRVGREAVIHGASFASQRPKGLKPYYFSATGQGTHMASLISRFYPQLQLYIARVDSDDAKIRPIIEVREDPTPSHP